MLQSHPHALPAHSFNRYMPKLLHTPSSSPTVPRSIQLLLLSPHCVSRSTHIEYKIAICMYNNNNNKTEGRSFAHPFLASTRLNMLQTRTLRLPAPCVAIETAHLTHTYLYLWYLHHSSLLLLFATRTIF